MYVSDDDGKDTNIHFETKVGTTSYTSFIFIYTLHLLNTLETLKKFNMIIVDDSSVFIFLTTHFKADDLYFDSK